jgi:hypothetical protein
MISATEAAADSSEDLQYRRNLLAGMRHAVCCETQACSSYDTCKQLKQLWIHMQHCHLPSCSHSICSLMKSILLHFQNCSAPADCPMCSCLTPNPFQAEEIIPADIEKGSNTNQKKPHISPSKAKEIKLHLVLLKHSLNCDGLNCTSMNCQKMREFIQHFKTCSGSGNNPTMVSGPSSESVAAVAEAKDDVCILCRRINNLHKLHSGICRDRSCSLSVCQEKRRKSQKVSKSTSLTGKLEEMKLK